MTRCKIFFTISVNKEFGSKLQLLLQKNGSHILILGLNYICMSAQICADINGMLKAGVIEANATLMEVESDIERRHEYYTSPQAEIRLINSRMMRR